MLFGRPVGGAAGLLGGRAGPTSSPARPLDNLPPLTSPDGHCRLGSGCDPCSAGCSSPGMHGVLPTPHPTPCRTGRARPLSGANGFSWARRRRRRPRVRRAGGSDGLRGRAGGGVREAVSHRRCPVHVHLRGVRRQPPAGAASRRLRQRALPPLPAQRCLSLGCHGPPKL